MINQAQTYEEIAPLVSLCKAGRLFEVQTWISAGRPVNPPEPIDKKPRKKSPLEIAIELGFHSLVQLLLDGGASPEEPRYSPLSHALTKRRFDLIELLVDHGADIHSIPMDEVFDTWNNDIVEYFIQKGADVETGNPLAVALCSRIRTALAIYKRYQDRFPSFQEQVNIALRYHCREGNLKWVSLMLWAGGDPYSKGPDSPRTSYPEDDESAVELAAFYGHVDIFKLKAIGLRPDRPGAADIFRHVCFRHNLSLLKIFLEKGFSPECLEDKGSAVIQALIGSMNRNSRRWGYTFGSRYLGDRDFIQMIHVLVRHGAHWSPVDEAEIREVRRSLLKMDSDFTMEFIWIMSEYNACSREAIDNLIKDRNMRTLLSKHASRLATIMDNFA